MTYSLRKQKDSGSYLFYLIAKHELSIDSRVYEKYFGLFKDIFFQILY